MTLYIQTLWRPAPPLMATTPIWWQPPSTTRKKPKAVGNEFRQPLPSSSFWANNLGNPAAVGPGKGWRGVGWGAIYQHCPELLETMNTQIG